MEGEAAVGGQGHMAGLARLRRAPTPAHPGPRRARPAPAAVRPLGRTLFPPPPPSQGRESVYRLALPAKSFCDTLLMGEGLGIGGILQRQTPDSARNVFLWPLKTDRRQPARIKRGCPSQSASIARFPDVRIRWHTHAASAVDCGPRFPAGHRDRSRGWGGLIRPGGCAADGSVR